MSEIWKESVAKKEELEVQITATTKSIEDMEEVRLLRVEVDKVDAAKGLSCERSAQTKEQMKQAWAIQDASVWKVSIQECNVAVAEATTLTVAFASARHKLDTLLKLQSKNQ